MKPTRVRSAVLAASVAVTLALTGGAGVQAAAPAGVPAQGDTPSPDEETTEPAPEELPPEEQLTPEDEQTTPDEETTPPDEETTTPDEETTSPDEDTTSPDEETTTPDEDTTSPEEETTTPEPDGDTYYFFFFDFYELYGESPGRQRREGGPPAAPPSGIDRQAVQRWLIQWANTPEARAFDRVVKADEMDYCAFSETTRAVEQNPDEPPGLTEEWDRIWKDLADASDRLCSDPGDLTEVNELTDGMRTLGRFEGVYLS